MGRYLDTLKKLEKPASEEPKKPNKPQKMGFLGLLVPRPSEFEKNIASNDGGKVTPTTSAPLETSVMLDNKLSTKADVDRSFGIAETPDNRRYCTQCLNLHGRICIIAYPGGLVSARRGYQPMRDVLHRCAGYSNVS